MLSQKLPDSLRENLEQIFGKKFGEFLIALDKIEIPSIRINPLKLSGCPFNDSTPVAWENNGFLLGDRPSYILDPLWHAGAYYVQESSSMFLSHLLKKAGLDMVPVKALDACAAPGGKTTHLLSTLHPDSLVVANELIPKRNKILIENLCRWGYPNTIVTQADIYRFSALTGFFDLLLVDAPCSGEGMLRRGPEVIQEWRDDTVKSCALRQKDILEHIVPLLKAGGFLLYSTCTYEPAENEEQVKWLLSNGFSQPDQFSGIEFPGITEMIIRANDKSVRAFRFDLHNVPGSGFFCCLLQKDNHTNSALNFTGFTSSFSVRRKNEYLADWVLRAADFTEIGNGDDLYALPTMHLKAFREINSTIKITYCGIHFGTMKGKIFTPAHPLALSSCVREEIPRWDVDRETAIKYLRKESLHSGIPQQNGWLIITYKGLGLGWIKNIDDRRINNYLPNEWRILK